MRYFLPFISMFMSGVLEGQVPAMPFQWKEVATLPSLQTGFHPGLGGPICGYQKGRLFVGGGSNFPDGMPWQGGLKKYCRTLYVYDQLRPDSLRLTGTFTLPAPVAYAAAGSTQEGVVYAGGENAAGISSKVYLLHYDSDKRTLVTRKLPELPDPLTGAMMAAIGNQVYMAGGDNEHTSTTTFRLLDLTHVEKGWLSLPPLLHPVSYGVLLAWPERHQLILIGGRCKQPGGISTLYPCVYAYDCVKEEWSQRKSLPYALSAGTGMVLNNHSLVLFGGDKGATFHQTELLISAIQQEKDPEKKKKLMEEKNQLQQGHPGFSQEVLLYDVVLNDWRPCGTLPFKTPVTTTAVPAMGGVLLPCGEIKAGVRRAEIWWGHPAFPND